MLYTICIALILIASVLVILAVLVQNPKSGMAANFGASNQVMGVRETSDFLEKFTWTMAIAIVVLSLVATLAMDKGRVAESNSEISKDAKALQERVLETEAPATMPQAEIPAQAPAETPAEQPAEYGSISEAAPDGREAEDKRLRKRFRSLFCIVHFLYTFPAGFSASTACSPRSPRSRCSPHFLRSLPTPILLCFCLWLFRLSLFAPSFLSGFALAAYASCSA
jgi:preprotein translocase, secG subunit